MVTRSGAGREKGGGYSLLMLRTWTTDSRGTLHHGRKKRLPATTLFPLSRRFLTHTLKTHSFVLIQHHQNCRASQMYVYDIGKVKTLATHRVCSRTASMENLLKRCASAMSLLLSIQALPLSTSYSRNCASRAKAPGIRAVRGNVRDRDG